MPKDKAATRLQWSATEAATLGYPSSASAWVSGCAVDSGSSAASVRSAVTAMLREAFTALPHVEALLIASMPEVERHAIGPHVTKLSKTTRYALYAVPRDVAAPPLRIRLAKVEDHDDLLPVLATAAADPNTPGGAIAGLPAGKGDDPSTRGGAAGGGKEEHYALARLIDDALRHPDRGCVLVAEAGDAANPRLVGVMALTADEADVDAPTLAAAYDLAAYDNLMEPTEEEPAPAEDDTHPGEAPAPLAEDTAVEAPAPEADASIEAPAPEADAPIEAPAPATEEADAPEGAEGDAPDASDAEAQAEEAEVAAEEAAPVENRPPPKCLAFRISMLCVDRAYALQTPEFLKHAFDAFPEKDFAVVTLPPASPELPLARAAMTRIAGASVEAVDALHVCHRAGTLPGFAVRAATPADALEVMDLLEGLPDQEAMAAAFSDAAASATTGFSAAVVATCEGQVVGYATLTCDVDVEPLRACFSLGDNVDLDQHAADGFAKLDECVMNPIFAHKRRLVILEAMRLAKKTCVLYQLAPGADQPPPPDVVTADFQLVAGRRSYSGLEAHFALYAFTARISSAPRLVVNSRVVVVGGTEEALSVVERLLTSPGCVFNNVSLVAPGGLQVGGAASAYTRASLAKLALETGGGVNGGVTVVDAAMVGLDRDTRNVYLDDDTALPYEMLVLATGRRDQTRFRLAAAEDLPVERLGDLAANLTPEEAGDLDGVVVYGDTLEALGAVRTLLNKGVKPAAIRVVTPPPTGAPGSGMMAVATAATGAIGGSVAWHMSAVEGQPKARSGLRLVGAETCEVGVRAYFDGPGVGKGGDEDNATAGVVSGEGAEATEAIEADFVVAADAPDIDPTVYACLNDASIVYDGAVVVDASFRTNDPDIYATGSIAKFSRRLGKGLVPLKYHDAKEVGAKLAESLIARARGEPPAVKPPALNRPRAESVIMPGKFQFLYVGAPGSFVNPTFESPPGGRSLVTTFEQYCRLDVDAEGVICGFYYCGDKKVDAARMGCIIGLPLSYLEIDDLYKKRQVEDLLEYLSQDALAALFHEKFAQRHHSLLALLNAGTVGGGGAYSVLGPASTKGTVQDVVLDFVKQHAHDLPHYAAAEV